MPKKLMAIAAAAVGLAVAASRIRAERAEADLWREATDDPASPTTSTTV